MPQISVVLPVFNGARTLGEALDSVLSQSFRDFDLIVVDAPSAGRIRHDAAVAVGDTAVAGTAAVIARVLRG